MSRRAVQLLLLLTLSLPFCSACNRSRTVPLKVGVVDTARIVADLPEYQDLNIDWLQEQSDFFGQLPEDPTKLSQEEREALREQARERSSRFDKVVKKFFEDAYRRIETASSEVAQAKGLDQVVIDTPYYPTIVYHSGENITTDILLKLRGD